MDSTLHLATFEARNEGIALDLAAVEVAIEVASRAPSIHNTQPWSWEYNGDTLTLRAVRSRQLAIADPDAHSLMISCGAALTLTELALRAEGWAVSTNRMPEPTDPDLLARFSDPRAITPSPEDTQNVEAALARFSDRRPFKAEELSADMSEQLRSAADAAGVHIHLPSRADELIELAVAVSHADRVEREDADYVAEMASWLREEPDRADGIPTTSIPHIASGHPRHTDVPLRDFEVGVSGRELIQHDVDERPTIAVILAEADTPLEQLLAGEAMMRLMLKAQVLGLATCALSQAVDFPAFRARLQDVMGWQSYPQMMLRVGHPLPSTQVMARTPRRPVSAVLTVLPR